MPYEYNATVRRVIDGDTIKADLDLGFNCWQMDLSLRIHGINARERGTPGGLAARDHLMDALPVGTSIVVGTIRPDKYGGRWLASITYGQRSLGDDLVAQGWAAAWDGIGAKPEPPWPRPS